MKPLVDFYRARPTFRAINGEQGPEKVASDLASAIEAAGMSSIPNGGRVSSSPAETRPPRGERA